MFARYESQHDEALKYFERALQIEQRATTNADTDTSLATTLYGIGRCLLGVNQHDKALKYIERALQFKQQARKKC